MLTVLPLHIVSNGGGDELVGLAFLAGLTALLGAFLAVLRRPHDG